MTDAASTAEPNGADAAQRIAMPRRKADALRRRLQYLRGMDAQRRSSYAEAEIAALEWVLARVMV